MGNRGTLVLAAGLVALPRTTAQIESKMSRTLKLIRVQEELLELDEPPQLGRDVAYVGVFVEKRFHV